MAVFTSAWVYVIAPLKLGNWLRSTFLMPRRWSSPSRRSSIETGFPITSALMNLDGPVRSSSAMASPLAVHAQRPALAVGARGIVGTQRDAAGLAIGRDRGIEVLHETMLLGDRGP